MESAKIQALFRQFLSEYDSSRKAEVWENQRQLFKRFWNDKILSPTSELTVDDTDAIIRLLDTKARGHQKKDEAVAATGGSQGRWERLFDSLRNKPDIRHTLDEIFAETDDSKLIGLIDRLEKENKNNKNSLTGDQAVVLNAFLFINNPTKFLSVVSLRHRSQIIRAFDLGNSDEFKTYGEQIVLSNRIIIGGFRDKYAIEANPRDLSEFLYTPHSGYTTNVKIYWQNGDQPVTETVEAAYEVASGEADEPKSTVGFALEKHLEDFLVRNWENTDLGKRYELIEEDGKFSQQYPTSVGNIDLLVRDKETKQHVVIELKKDQTSDATVGQVTRYMGWVKENLANGDEVNGIIIARSNDRRLQYALQVVRNVELFVYKVSFALERAAGSGSQKFQQAMSKGADVQAEPIDVFLNMNKENVSIANGRKDRGGSGRLESRSRHLAKRWISADEYEHMGEAGIFGEDARLELLEGEIYEMSPIGSPHAACVDVLIRLLTELAQRRFIVRGQNPIRLNDHSEPQPDVAIVQWRDDFYRLAHPTPADVLLVIEVADTTLETDRNVKIPLYAQNGIPEAWLINLPEECVELYAEPKGGVYQTSKRFARGEVVESHGVENLSVNVSDILG